MNGLQCFALEAAALFFADFNDRDVEPSARTWIDPVPSVFVDQGLARQADAFAAILLVERAIFYGEPTGQT